MYFYKKLGGRGNISGCIEKIKNEFQIAFCAKDDHITILSIGKMHKIISFRIFPKIIISFGFFSETKIYEI